MENFFSKMIKSISGSDKEETNDSVELGSRDLCVKVLESLNCLVDEDEVPNGRLIFTYQGEHFIIYATNDCRIITIWDMYWYEVKLDDIDRMSRVRKAVNEVNIRNTNTLVYSTNEVENSFNIHTKRSILLHDMLDIEKYLSSMLESFFIAQREFFCELEEIGKEESAR